MRRFIVLAAVFALVAGACTRQGEEPATTSAPPGTSSTTRAATTTTSAPDGPVYQRAVFADLEMIPLLTDTPPYAGPETPGSLEDIYIPESFLFELDPSAQETLAQQGFVIVPGTARLLHPLYQETFYEGEVHFVTTDAGYHYLHLAFSKVLRDLEQQELAPILEDLLTGLVAEARTQRELLAGTDLADAADRVAQLYEAAATLLGLDVGPIGDLAQQEVALAIEATQLIKSPITGLIEVANPEVSMLGLVDYSLFQPRGHYTRNQDLERYFRAMSVLGNENFSVGYEETMVLAALASRVLVEDPALLEAWSLVYKPTAFLVGTADDYTPAELAAQLDELIPGWRDDPTMIDPQLAIEAGRRLLETRSVGIDPEAASVRIMGVRFVIDSYIYDQLRFPSVGDPPIGRIYATPLDLVAAFGSELAYRLMETEVIPFQPVTESGAFYLTDPETGDHWTHYDDQLSRLTAMLADRVPSDWARTVYDAWLYALEPVWSPLGLAYPDFMQTLAWEVKDLQTGLGSYTELKHDTILYAKQSFAAEGGSDFVEFPAPRHWVEPNPVAFQRMAAALRLLEDGLADRGLLPTGSDNAELIDAMGEFLGRLTRLASDELAGEPISTEDNDWLGTVGSTMEALWIQSADKQGPDPGAFPDQDTNSAVIADIMRTTYNVLEIGTGYFDSLYALVPDDSGQFQVAKGGVFSYYEFWRDADDGRLTDEEWWEMLATQPPERPVWEQPVFPGG